MLKSLFKFKIIFNLVKMSVNIHALSTSNMWGDTNTRFKPLYGDAEP